MNRSHLLVALIVAALVAASVFAARFIRSGANNAALLNATQSGDLGTVQSLLDAGADPNVRHYPRRPLFDFGRDDGTPAVVVAVAGKHWAVAELLLDRGAVPPEGGEGIELLLQATDAGAIGAMRALVDRGVPVDGRAVRHTGYSQPGRTALTNAVAYGKAEAAAWLLDHGASMAPALDRHPTIRFNDFPCSPFGWSAGDNSGNGAIVRCLVERGLSVDYRHAGGWHNGRPLMAAAVLSGDRALVEYLLDRGAKVDAKDGQGWSALYWATIQNRREIAALLEKAGAKKDW